MQRSSVDLTASVGGDEADAIASVESEIKS